MILSMRCRSQTSAQHLLCSMRLSNSAVARSDTGNLTEESLRHNFERPRHLDLLGAYQASVSPELREPNIPQKCACCRLIGHPGC